MNHRTKYPVAGVPSKCGRKLPVRRNGLPTKAEIVALQRQAALKRESENERATEPSAAPALHEGGRN